MTHSMTLVESSKEEVFDSLWNRPAHPFPMHTSPRWLNKQLKFLLSNLQVTLMEKVLLNLTQTLRVSEKTKIWALNFACILMLAMANESIQVTLRCKEATDKEEGVLDPDNLNATHESHMIDEKFDFLRDLYCRKYKTRDVRCKFSFDPVQNVVNRGELDAPSSQFAQSVGDILGRYRKLKVNSILRRITDINLGDFLESRQKLGLPTATEPNSSRLVARFLLSF